MFDPQANVWGSFDPLDPTVPAPLIMIFDVKRIRKERAYN